jgi:AcrR family transcriptional regulator
MTSIAQDTDRRGEATRRRILDLTAELAAAKGFSATSVEELTMGVGLTKSGFFYHFPSKLRLAQRLLQRLMSEDAALFEDLERTARRLHGDPLWSLLEFLDALAERASAADGWRPGARLAAAVYQETSYDREIRKAMVADADRRRTWLGGWLAEIAERWPPRRPVDLHALAEALMAALYGNPLLAGPAQAPQALVGQLRLYRDWIAALFAPRSEALEPIRRAA